MSSWPPGFNHDWAQRRWRGNEWKDKSINVASSQRYKFKDGVRRCSHGSVWKGPACRLCAGLCLCCRPHRRILLGTSSLWHQPPQTGPEAENTLLIVFFIFCLSVGFKPIQHLDILMAASRRSLCPWRCSPCFLTGPGRALPLRRTEMSHPHNDNPLTH